MKNDLAFALIPILICLPAIVLGQTPDMPVSKATTPAQNTTSAQFIYLDPQTGRLVSEPPPGVPVHALSPEELNMISSSHQDLEQIELPGGGYMLDLKGRFRHMAVATVGEDGTIAIRDVAGEAFLPANPDQAENSENDE